MTIEEKKEKLADFCLSRESCFGINCCPLVDNVDCGYDNIMGDVLVDKREAFDIPDEDVDKAFELAFPDENESPKPVNEVVFKDGHTEPIIHYSRCGGKTIEFTTATGKYRYLEDSEGINHEFQKETNSCFYIEDHTIDYLTWNAEELTGMAKLKDCTTKDSPVTTIKDSGARREFETGAVRDIQEGKGRCDLMPLDVVAWVEGNDETLELINQFQNNGEPLRLVRALDNFLIDQSTWTSHHEMLLETAKQFEDGAKKYGEYNWQKGIPTHCYIDSAVRHYLKHLRGDTDEPHDRAFCWNILCCIWTCIHKPELNDYAKKENT